MENLTEEEEIKHYKDLLKRIRIDYCQMVSDDFKRYEEEHNVNIYDKLHETGDISNLNYVLSNYNDTSVNQRRHYYYKFERMRFDKTYIYAKQIRNIRETNYNFIANSIHEDVLQKLVLINELYKPLGLRNPIRGCIILNENDFLRVLEI